MPKNQEPSLKNKENLSNFTKYSSLAFQMIAIIAVGVFGGIQLDRWVGTPKPIFTICLSLFSVVGAIYFAVKDFIVKK